MNISFSAPLCDGSQKIYGDTRSKFLRVRTHFSRLYFRINVRRLVFDVELKAGPKKKINRYSSRANNRLNVRNRSTTPAAYLYEAWIPIYFILFSYFVSAQISISYFLRLWYSSFIEKKLCNSYRKGYADFPPFFVRKNF